MTGIPYCDETLNVTAGCTKCSPGCENCWAEKMAHRLKHICLATNNNPQYLGKTDKDGHWTGKVECCPWLLDQPRKWKNPRRIFVNSMSDLFHPKVPFEFICKVFETIADASQHTYLIFTKRVEEMKEFFQSCEDWDASEWPNVQLILSLSTQAEADKKIPILLDILAAVRGLSLEPLLEDIDLTGFKPWYGTFKENQKDKGLHWVVVGCESGSKRRPCKLEWVRSIVNQCQAARVPIYVKQLPINGKVSRNPKEWPKDLRVQQYPKIRK